MEKTHTARRKTSWHSSHGEHSRSSSSQKRLSLGNEFEKSIHGFNQHQCQNNSAKNESEGVCFIENLPWVVNDEEFNEFLSGKYPRLKRLYRRLQTKDENMNDYEKNRIYSNLKFNSSLLKNKSFLVGSAGSSQYSLMGGEELDIVIPGRQLSVYAVSWNMANPRNENMYPQSWDGLLLPEALKKVAHIYVISLQECPNNCKEIYLRIQESLGPYYLPIAGETMGNLSLFVFISRELIWHYKINQCCSIKTNAAILTKGAIALTCTVFGTSFLFLNCHLPSDEGNVEARIAAYQKVCDMLNDTLVNGLPAKLHSANRKNFLKHYDAIFWMGDLNFRINASRDTVENIIDGMKNQKEPNYELLLQIDELFCMQTENKAFQYFQEGRIVFKPTYKYDLNSDKYDTSELCRIPSYTDRILFHCRHKLDISCTHYNSIHNIRTSDHRAVYGVYECVIKPGCDRSDICSADFNRDIYKEGNRRRAIRLDYLVNQSAKNSRVCVLL